MTSNKRRTRTTNRIIIRYRPQFDGLEARFVLSDLGISDPNRSIEDNSTVLVGAGLDQDEPEAFASFGIEQASFVGSMSVLETDPSSGSATSQSISTVSVTFDREIDPFTIIYGDFFLDRSADPNGSARTITVKTAFLDDSDTSNRRVSFTLNNALPIGEYQIKLSGHSELAGMDGTRATAGEDQILGSFRIESAQLAVERAHDLGSVGGAKIEHHGNLDLTSNPAASDLYKFTIPKGQEWDFSLDVLAQRDGISLDATAILYDAQGIEIAIIDRGKSDAPLDPSSTRSLAGGDYYIAISGRLTGGSTDGSYRLQLSAAPSLSKTSLVDIHELRANPNTLELTGLSIKFSNPIDPDSLLIDMPQILRLVDKRGQSWPILLTGLSSDQTTLTFVLGAPLPAGSYQVMLGVESKLTDVFGRAPSGRGPVAGVLGSIEVVALSKPPATDLGTLWANQGSKVSGVVSLADGVAQTRSFTLLAHGSVTLSVIGDTKSAHFTILDAEGRPVPNLLTFNSEMSGPGENHWIYVLDAGTYTLSIEADEPVDVTFGVSLVVKETPASSLLDSGVGQGATTGPRMISPSPPSAGEANPPVPGSERGGSALPPDRGSKGTTPIAEPIAGDITDHGPDLGPMESTFVLTSPAGSDQAATIQSPLSLNSPGENLGATLLVGGVPAGHPATTFDIIDVVGPAPSTGSFALASTHPTLHNGLLQQVAESLIADSNVVGEPAGTIWGRPGSSRRNALPIAFRDEGRSEVADSTEDLSTLDMNIDLGWFTRVAGWVEDFLDNQPPPGLDPDVPSEAIVIEAGDPGAETAQHIDSASLASPALLIGTVLAVYRTRAKMRKRARRSGERVEQERPASRRDGRPRSRWGFSR